MSKYLVRYNIQGYSKDYQESTIYETENDMSYEDVVKFEDEMTKTKHGMIVTMISFDKLYEKPKSLEELNKEKLPKLAAFFLFDKDYKEAVLVYTNVDDIVSYTFEASNFCIVIKDDKGSLQKKYSCPIPGIWIGGEDIFSQMPKGLMEQFPHTYLFSIEYDGYATV